MSDAPAATVTRAKDGRGGFFAVDRRVALALFVALQCMGGCQAFAAMPAPVVAVENPCSHLPREGPVFMCNYDAGQVALTPRCKVIVQEAAQAFANAVACSPTSFWRFLVEGHAQDLGYAPGDDQLSLRRAAAISAELQRLGVPEDRLTVVGYGTSQPLVSGPTPSPMNRYARVVFW